MAADGRTMHGGTYNSNTLVCAAVIAAAGVTGADGFYEDLNARGARLAEGLVAAANDAGLEACWSGVGGDVPAVVLGCASHQLPRGLRDLEAQPVRRSAPGFPRATVSSPSRPRRDCSSCRAHMPTPTSTARSKQPQAPCRLQPSRSSAARSDVREDCGENTSGGGNPGGDRAGRGRLRRLQFDVRIRRRRLGHARQRRHPQDRHPQQPRPPRPGPLLHQ